MDLVPTCSVCEYALSGLADGNCPECGAPFVVAERIAAERLRIGSNTAFKLSLVLTLAGTPLLIVVAPELSHSPRLAIGTSVVGICVASMGLWFAAKASKSPTRAVMAFAWLPAILAVVALAIAIGLGGSGLAELLDIRTRY